MADPINIFQAPQIYRLIQAGLKNPFLKWAAKILVEPY